MRTCHRHGVAAEPCRAIGHADGCGGHALASHAFDEWLASPINPGSRSRLTRFQDDADETTGVVSANFNTASLPVEIAGRAEDSTRRHDRRPFASYVRQRVTKRLFVIAVGEVAMLED